MRPVSGVAPPALMPMFNTSFLNADMPESPDGVIESDALAPFTRIAASGFVGYVWVRSMLAETI